MSETALPPTTDRAAHDERTFVHPAGGVVHELHGPSAGVPVLALPGLGSDRTDLRAVARESGERTILCDPPGFGDAGRPDRAYPLAGTVEAACRLLDELGIESAVWLGCSYGGHVATRAALDRPDRVRALCLVSSGGLEPEPDPAVAAAYDEEAMKGRSPAEVEAACRLLARRETEATRRFRRRRVAVHASDVAPVVYRTIARLVEGALADDAGRRLEEVDRPVELVHGAHDPLVPVERAREAADRFPRARLAVLPEAGHLPWLETPGAVAAAVRRTVRRSVRDA